jgi:hypothetical protein
MNRLPTVKNWGFRHVHRSRGGRGFLTEGVGEYLMPAGIDTAEMTAVVVKFVSPRCMVLVETDSGEDQIGNEGDKEH